MSKPVAEARLITGDCIESMRELDEASVDSIVTDPPYGLGFMGKKWDALPPGSEFGAEALRVLKPGGHLLAFGGTRTYHRLTCALEDAGFEIRDCIAWMYGSGFPKSLDVSKAIDKAAGAEREVVGPGQWVAVRGTARGASQGASNGGEQGGYNLGAAPDATAPATPEADQWDGWGTALKPAFEPIVVARKPFKGTVAANVLAHGTGAINVDGCRVGTGEDKGVWPTTDREVRSETSHSGGVMRCRETDTSQGRWPANVVLDEEAAGLLDGQAGERVSGSRAAGRRAGLGYHGASGDGGRAIAGSAGGASRFFYVAKASRKERDAGLESRVASYEYRGNGFSDKLSDTKQPRANTHPTVKPIALMRWLVRLVTPPDGLVLDPFLGSGTTGIAASLEGFRFAGIEREEEYVALARARIDFWAEHGEDSLRAHKAAERARAPEKAEA